MSRIEGICTNEYKLTLGKTETGGTFWVSLTHQNNKTEKTETVDGFFGREEAEKMIGFLQQWLSEGNETEVMLL